MGRRVAESLRSSDLELLGDRRYSRAYPNPSDQFVFNTTLVNYMVICGNGLAFSFIFFYFFSLTKCTSGWPAPMTKSTWPIGVRSKFVRTLEGAGHKSSPRSPRASSYINGNDLV